MNSIEEIKDEFESKIKAITVHRIIRNDAYLQCLAGGILQDLECLEVTLQKMEMEIERKVKLIKKQEDLMEMTSKIKELYNHNNNNNNNNNESTASSSALTTSSSLPNGTTPTQIKKRFVNYDYDDYLNTQEDDEDENGSKFTKLPKKYMIGRLSVEKINNTIDTLNQVCGCKYDILITHKSKQTDKIRNAIREYKNEENGETKGFNFITENDIKQFGQIKIDKSLFSILTILRHCGRIREVRGGNLVRYLIT
ncbi:hypothetical protein HELRODRAFT_181546 [Helobdella robusta]|uniref:SKA complex subunit 1 n=1 Tax=Helobdella robusta TaxID=6412 RepID=T1FH33_HELRO|nr:hypothetical protein HELRODRAFT_181546 [Helobdella robusta]ESN92348.1 hypothetical protein HELRODRAFT_181546 [Helobdella robusta]